MSSASLAPICIFVYNRPEHTEKMLRSLISNPLFAESEVFVFADGPKDDAKLVDIEKIKQVREKLNTLESNKKVHFLFSETNKGLTNSMIPAITKIIKKYDKVIVLEDDLELSPGFLKYMNDALNLYENEERVMHVGGYMVPHNKNLPETFFLRAPTIWGWGTWERAWTKFEPDANVLLSKLEYKFGKNVFYDLDIKGSYNYHEQLIKIANKSHHEVWDIQWAASIYLWEGLCLHPQHSLSKNNGFDGSGVHCYPSDLFIRQELLSSIGVRNELVQINELGVKAFMIFFKEQNKEEENKYLMNSGMRNKMKFFLKKIAGYLCVE